MYHPKRFTYASHFAFCILQIKFTFRKHTYAYYDFCTNELNHRNVQQTFKLWTLNKNMVTINVPRSNLRIKFWKCIDNSLAWIAQWYFTVKYFKMYDGAVNRFCQQIDYYYIPIENHKIQFQTDSFKIHLVIWMVVRPSVDRVENVEHQMQTDESRDVEFLILVPVAHQQLLLLPSYMLPFRLASLICISKAWNFSLQYGNEKQKIRKNIRNHCLTLKLKMFFLFQKMFYSYDVLLMVPDSYIYFQKIGSKFSIHKFRLMLSRLINY